MGFLFSYFEDKWAERGLLSQSYLNLKLYPTDAAAWASLVCPAWVIACNLKGVYRKYVTRNRSEAQASEGDLVSERSVGAKTRP